MELFWVKIITFRHNHRNFSAYLNFRQEFYWLLESIRKIYLNCNYPLIVMRRNRLNIGLKKNFQLCRKYYVCRSSISRLKCQFNWISWSNMIAIRDPQFYSSFGKSPCSYWVKNMSKKKFFYAITHQIVTYKRNN